MKKKLEEINSTTLQEAIDHAYAKSQELGDCECGREHRQLADWLTELQELRAKQAEMEKACEEEFERCTGYSVNEIRDWREKNGYPPLP